MTSSLVCRARFVVVAIAFLSALDVHAFQGEKEPLVNPAVPASEEKLATIIQEVKQGNWPEVQLIARVASAQQAMPILRALFASSQDFHSRLQLAAELVKLKDPDETYWNYLADQTTSIIDSDEPEPFDIEANNSASSAQYSAGYIDWARAHQVSITVAPADKRLDVQMTLGSLAATRDPRAIPLLRRALRSRKVTAQIVASHCLGTYHDKDSIPYIVEACARAPKRAATLIATGLLFFDDPEADRAALPCLSKDQIGTLQKQGRLHLVDSPKN